MSKKNRNGKPTAFQVNTLKELGFSGKAKTYRDAENAIKRLRNAKAKKPAKKGKPCSCSCKKPIRGKDTCKVALPASAPNRAREALIRRNLEELSDCFAKIDMLLASIFGC